jgi:hypothetical protein
MIPTADDENKKNVQVCGTKDRDASVDKSMYPSDASRKSQQLQVTITWKIQMGR